MNSKIEYLVKRAGNFTYQHPALFSKIGVTPYLLNTAQAIHLKLLGTGKPLFIAPSDLSQISPRTKYITEGLAKANIDYLSFSGNLSAVQNRFALKLAIENPSQVIGVFRYGGMRIHLDRGVLLVETEESFIKRAEQLKILAEAGRRDIIEMIAKASSGHPGGSLSVIDIITGLYFGGSLRYLSESPKSINRDRFILSEGHVCPALYYALSRAGFFDRNELSNLRQVDSLLQGHPDARKTPGIDMSTGALGQGLSDGVGMALSAKMQNKNYRVTALIGDGEEQEGQISEAARYASTQKLNNLTAIINVNGLQIDGRTREVDSTDLVARWKAYGWHVVKIDGHNMPDILDALDKAKGIKGMPTVIIARTIKGKGVSFMENEAKWHGKAPDQNTAAQALTEINSRLPAVEQNIPIPSPVIPKEIVRDYIGEDTSHLSLPLVPSPTAFIFKEGKPISTRQAFGEWLIKAGEIDPSIVTLSPDLTESVKMDEFAKIFGYHSPDNRNGRHFRMPITEQNVASVASGLAMAGKTPIVATFGAFIKLMLIQIEKMAYSQLPVILVGTHAGLGVGEDGPSHQDITSLEMMRSIPTVQYFEPADARDAIVIFNHILSQVQLKRRGPYYVRVTRQGIPVLPSCLTDRNIEANKKENRGPNDGYTIYSPYGEHEFTLFASGAMITNAFEALDLLNKRGVAARLITISGFRQLHGLHKEFKKIGELGISVIDSSPSSLSTPVFRRTYGRGARIRALGVRDFSSSGKPEELYHREGLDPEAIVSATLAFIKKMKDEG